MKIVLTLNELKASHELFARVGVATDELNRVVSDMKNGETITQEDIIRKLDVSDEAIAKLNQNRNIMSVTKHLDGNGTTCFTMIISEEFICDINNLYGDLIVKVIEKVKFLIIALKGFFSDRIKQFLDKWKLN